MRVVLQRVREAQVTISGRISGEIGAGFVLLAGFAPTDTEAEVEWMAAKVRTLRLFADDAGKMNLDIEAVGGEVLVVSQFTLLGDASRGRRPSFIGAADPTVAIPLYESFVAALKRSGLTVATGEFGADMQVALVNDGPVTLILDRVAGA